MRKRKRNFRNSKGITLIALVITIIVLLVLAGISISTLMGDNGMILKATTAKEQTETAETIERARVDISEVQAENKSGDITKKQFIEILNKYFDEVPTEETLPEDLSELILKTKTEYGSHDIKVSDIWNGTFGGVKKPAGPSFDENTFTLGTSPSDAQNTDKYGWKVPEYTVTTEKFTTGVWRLFYQDNNYTYLITDECIGVGRFKSSSYYEVYQTGADVSTVGQKLSPAISSLFTATNTNLNIRTTAWLTDTSDSGMWSCYKNEDAVFALGSPTVELFAISYSNRRNKSNTISPNLYKNGYHFAIGSGWLSVSDNYGIYSLHSSICIQ